MGWDGDRTGQPAALSEEGAEGRLQGPWWPLGPREGQCRPGQPASPSRPELSHCQPWPHRVQMVLLGPGSGEGQAGPYAVTSAYLNTWKLPQHLPAHPRFV